VTPKELIKSLRLSRKLKVVCPHCEETTTLSQASLFTEDDLSAGAHDFLQKKKIEIMELKKELFLLKRKRLERVLKGAQSSGLGKILEKFVPILPGFPFKPEESIPLLDPIDFISFTGLSNRRVELVSFMDVKSGKARLKPDQKAIKEVVEQGKVSVELIERRYND
jgi:predicted Holliday junction resolvase-like endonuclease